jgi:hypothetical protein
MKKIILTILTGFIVLSSSAQDKKNLTISLATGFLNSPYYTNAKTRQFYNVDFTYHLNERHKIASSFLSGEHLYYDNEKSNNAVPLTTPGYEENTNATADYRVFSILYKYAFLNKKKISITLAAGAGIMTQVVVYPYTEVTPTGVVIVDFRQSSWTDLVFPVRLDIDYRLSKRFQIGLIGGFFIQPDYPVLGYHAGPRLSFTL